MFLPFLIIQVIKTAGNLPCCPYFLPWGVGSGPWVVWVHGEQLHVGLSPLACRLRNGPLTSPRHTFRGIRMFSVVESRSPSYSDCVSPARQPQLQPPRTC